MIRPKAAPRSSAQPGCSAMAWADGTELIGTASTTQRLVLVECPLPWPSETNSIPALTVGALPATTRLLAIVPGTRAGPLVPRITVWQRAANGFEGQEMTIDCPGGCDPASHVAAVARGESHAHVRTVGPAGPQVLICTHGRRDRCCGRLGTRLNLDVAGRWADVEVRRCSHLGGHRFAPTAITLPDGRCWGRLDADTLVAIVERSADPALITRCLRGFIGLDPWAQVVDRLLTERFGWAWLEQSVTFATSVAHGGTSASVDVSWATNPSGFATGLVDLVGQEPSRDCATGVPTGKVTPRLGLRSLEIGPVRNAVPSKEVLHGAPDPS